MGVRVGGWGGEVRTSKKNDANLYLVGSRIDRNITTDQ